MDNQQTGLYYQQNPTARLLVLINICIGGFLAPLSLSATLVAVPAIAQGLNANAVYASWIPTAFLLSNLITLLPAGRLSDSYGRKFLYILGTSVFLLSSILAGIANSIEALLFFRVIQGMGAAMFFSTSMAIVGSVYNGNGRGAALGWMVASVYTGLTCGPLLGGWLTEHFGWHSVFLFQVPLSLLTIFLSVFYMKGEWRSHEPVKLDWWGSLLLAVWVLSLFAGVTNLPQQSAYIYLLIAIVFLLVFIRHSSVSSNPIIRLKLVWQNHNLSRSLLAAVFMYSANYGLMFLLGLYLQYNRGLSPADAGKMLMLQAVVMAVVAPVAGRLSDHYPPRNLATTGCLFAALGTFMLLFVDQDRSLIYIGSALMMLGLGFGFFSTPNSNSIFGSVAETKLGIVSALLNLARMMGQMVGMAIITLLISLLIGKTKINPTQFEALFEVLRWTLGLSFLFALAAAFFSHSKKMDQNVEKN
jgi:EmrB/QacA subfamily drug resistance transporter